MAGKRRLTGAQARLFAPEVYPEDFERFWKAYPARNGRKGKSKKLACEMWNRLNATDKRWCLAAAKKLARAAENGEATPDAERFFVPTEDPLWMRYAEDEERKDRRALEIAFDRDFDPNNPESVKKLRESGDPAVHRVVLLLDEGAL